MPVPRGIPPPQGPSLVGSAHAACLGRIEKPKVSQTNIFCSKTTERQYLEGFGLLRDSLLLGPRMRVVYTNALFDDFNNKTFLRLNLKLVYGR